MTQDENQSSKKDQTQNQCKIQQLKHLVKQQLNQTIMDQFQQGRKSNNKTFFSKEKLGIPKSTIQKERHFFPDEMQQGQNKFKHSNKVQINKNRKDIHRLSKDPFKKTDYSKYQKITDQIGLNAILCLDSAFPQISIYRLVKAIKEQIQRRRQQQRPPLIRMTMDQLQTYHLASGVKKFNPPQSNYSYASLRIKQQQRYMSAAKIFQFKHEQVKFQNSCLIRQGGLQEKLTQQQQFKKIQQVFCLTKLVRQSKSYADLKKIIFKKCNNRDAFQMSNKQKYMKKLATMKETVVYFFKIGYDIKKMRTLMDNYTLSRFKYKQFFFNIMRLLVRLIQTFIVKYQDSNITAIPHNQALLMLQAPFHHPHEHFPPKAVQIYFKILRLMFEIQNVQQQILVFQDILYFYGQLKDMIQKIVRQRQKYRQSTNQKLMSLIRDKHTQKKQKE